MDHAITKARLDAICPQTGISYYAMTLKMLKYVAANLEDGIIYESERILGGCYFYDVVVNGITEEHSIIQMIGFTLPYKFYLKLKWLGIVWPAIDRTAEFEMFVWLLYKQADKLTNHFQLKLISNPNK